MKTALAVFLYAFSFENYKIYWALRFGFSKKLYLKPAIKEDSL